MTVIVLGGDADLGRWSASCRLARGRLSVVAGRRRGRRRRGRRSFTAAAARGRDEHDHRHREHAPKRSRIVFPPGRLTGRSVRTLCASVDPWHVARGRFARRGRLPAPDGKNATIRSSGRSWPSRSYVRYVSRRVRAARARAAVAAGLAARVHGRPRRAPRRLPRVPRRATLGAGRAGRRRRAPRVPERVPAPRQRALRGHRRRADRDPLPVPPLDLGPGRPAARGAVAPRVRRPQRRLSALSRCRSIRGARWCSSTSTLDAEPLDAFLERGARRQRVGAPRRVSVHCCRSSMPARCNWKTLIDGFSETYHVQGIHREMLPMCDDVNGPQRVWERHGKLEQSYGLPSPRLRDGPTTSSVWEAVRRGHGRARRQPRRSATPGRRRTSRPAARCGRAIAAIVRDRGLAARSRLVRRARRRPAARHAAVQPVPEHHGARVLRHGAGRAVAPGRDARRRVHGRVRVRTRSRAGDPHAAHEADRRGAVAEGDELPLGLVLEPGLRQLRAQPSGACTSRASPTSRCRRPRSAGSSTCTATSRSTSGSRRASLRPEL